MRPSSSRFRPVLDEPLHATRPAIFDGIDILPDDRAEKLYLYDGNRRFMV